MRMIELSQVAILMVGLLVGPCWAVSLFDNGMPDGEGFVPSDSDFSGSAPFGRAGDVFTLAAGATVTDIEWWGVYFPSNTASLTDKFMVGVYTFDGGIPRSDPLFTFDTTGVLRVDSGNDLGGFDIYNYKLSGLDAPLIAGQYLLSMVNDTRGDAASDWYWATSLDLSGESWLRSLDDVAWVEGGGELAFNLDGIGASSASVPEPSVFVPLLGALSLLGNMVLGGRLSSKAGCGVQD